MKESDKKGVSHPDGAVLMGAENSLLYRST